MNRGAEAIRNLAEIHTIVKRLIDTRCTDIGRLRVALLNIEVWSRPPHQHQRRHQRKQEAVYGSRAP